MDDRPARRRVRASIAAQDHRPNARSGRLRTRSRPWANRGTVTEDWGADDYDEDGIEAQPMDVDDEPTDPAPA